MGDPVGAAVVAHDHRAPDRGHPASHAETQRYRQVVESVELRARPDAQHQIAVLHDPREGDVEAVFMANTVGDGPQHGVRVEEAEPLLTLRVQAEEQIQALQDLLLALAVTAHGGAPSRIGIVRADPTRQPEAPHDGCAATFAWRASHSHLHTERAPGPTDSARGGVSDCDSYGRVNGWIFPVTPV